MYSNSNTIENLIILSHVRNKAVFYYNHVNTKKINKITNHELIVWLKIKKTRCTGQQPEMTRFDIPAQSIDFIAFIKHWIYYWKHREHVMQFVSQKYFNSLGIIFISHTIAPQPSQLKAVASYHAWLFLLNTPTLNPSCLSRTVQHTLTIELILDSVSRETEGERERGGGEALPFAVVVDRIRPGAMHLRTVYRSAKKTYVLLRLAESRKQGNPDERRKNGCAKDIYSPWGSAQTRRGSSIFWSCVAGLWAWIGR